MVSKEERKMIAEYLAKIRKILTSSENNPMDSETKQTLLGVLEALEEELKIGYILKKKG